MYLGYYFMYYCLSRVETLFNLIDWQPLALRVYSVDPDLPGLAIIRTNVATLSLRDH